MGFEHCELRVLAFISSERSVTYKVCLQFIGSFIFIFMFTLIFPCAFTFQFTSIIRTFMFIAMYICASVYVG